MRDDGSEMGDRLGHWGKVRGLFRHGAKLHLGCYARERIDAECARRGTEAVVADCVALLQGETNPDLLSSLAGPGAERLFHGAEHKDTYCGRYGGCCGHGTPVHATVCAKRWAMTRGECARWLPR
jgi:hypothetical protein